MKYIIMWRLLVFQYFYVKWLIQLFKASELTHTHTQTLATRLKRKKGEKNAPHFTRNTLKSVTHSVCRFVVNFLNGNSLHAIWWLRRNDSLYCTMCVWQNSVYLIAEMWTFLCAFVIGCYWKKEQSNFFSSKFPCFKHQQHWTNKKIEKWIANT